MRKFMKLLAIVLVLTMSVGFVLVGCDKRDEEPEAEPAVNTYVTVDINPSVELVADENGLVVGIIAGNSDAEVLLYNTDLKGMSIDAAVGKIADLSIQMGYLTEENNDVNVTVSGSATVDTNAIYNGIVTSVNAVLTAADIEGHVNRAIDYVLQYELDELKAANANKAGYDESLTVEKYRLVKRAMRADRHLTTDAAVVMTTEELIAKVDAAKELYSQKLSTAYAHAVQDAQKIYDTAEQGAIDAAYAQVFLERANLSSVTLGAKAASYTSLRAARVLIGYYTTRINEYFDNPTFTDEDVLALANALGISNGAAYDAFKAEITDSEGNITKDSVSAYINAQYMELPEVDRQNFEAAYASVQSVFDSLGASLSISKDSINATLAGCSLSIRIDTYEDMDEVLAAMDEAIATLKAEMEGEMTEAELARLAEIQQNTADSIAGFKAAMNQTIADADAAYQAWIQGEYEARIEISIG